MSTVELTVATPSVGADIRPIARLQRRTIATLIATQVTGGLGLAAAVTVGSLIAADLGGAAAAGLPLTAAVAGTAATAYPLSLIMRRAGRRRGLRLGWFTGAAGALVAVSAVSQGSLPLLIAGMVLFGAAEAASSAARFAAADLAPLARRGIAIGTVVCSTAVTATVGPVLVGPVTSASAAAGMAPLAGPFALSALAFVVPRQFRDRAAGDWRRWLAAFTTVVWKLGQPAPPPPATMAEQLCVGVLTHYAQTAVVDLARDGAVALDLPHQDDGVDLTLWTDLYLADVDHEPLYDPALDGIDDDTTDHQYGFGRMDYEGMFAAFNEHNDTYTGAPHPLAPLRMTADEWDTEQRLQQAAAAAAVAVAQAAAAGAAPPASTSPTLAWTRTSSRTGSAACWVYGCKRRRRPPSNWSAPSRLRPATDSLPGSTTTTRPPERHVTRWPNPNGSGRGWSARQPALAHLHSTGMRYASRAYRWHPTGVSSTARTAPRRRCKRSASSHWWTPTAT